MICQKIFIARFPAVEREFTREFYEDDAFQYAEQVSSKLKIPSEELQFGFGDTNHVAFGATIPEFDDKNVGTYTSSPYKMVNLFEKYFKGENTVFVFKDIELQKWFFYDIDDVISITSECCTWKILENGRIRGYLKDKKGLHQYITYEPVNGSMFFGISSSKANRFNEFLKGNIAKYECDCEGVVSI